MDDPGRDVLDAGSLPAVLANRARQATDRRLALDAGTGLVVAVAVLVFKPPLWMPLAALASCFASFGVWGILDRELPEAPARTRSHRGLRAARAGVAVLGALLGLFGGLTLFFTALGRWIS